MKTLTILPLVAALLVVPALAQRGDRDHDAARAAVERGEIKPLATILEGLKDKLPGEVVGVKIERRRGAWVYEFRVSAPQGRLFEVYVDAASGAIERIKEK